MCRWRNLSDNNLERVDCPRYRRLSLPVTSTTEKFWNDPQGAEAILTMRAALLSEGNRLNDFAANQPACRTAAARRSSKSSDCKHATAP